MVVWGGCGKSSDSEENRLCQREIAATCVLLGACLREEWAEPGSVSKVSPRSNFYENEPCFLRLRVSTLIFPSLQSPYEPPRCSFLPGLLPRTQSCQTGFSHLPTFLLFFFLPSSLTHLVMQESDKSGAEWSP